MRTIGTIVNLVLWVSLPLLGQRPLVKHVPLDSQYGRNRISQSYIDHRGILWLGADQGLFSFDGHEFILYSHPDTSSLGGEVTALYEDPHHRLWVGYASGKIDLIDGNHLRTWDIQEGLPKSPIRSFITDPEDCFWIATYGEGVYSYRDQHLYNFDEDDGLTSNDIYCMELCNNGMIWLGTDRGLNICTWRNNQKFIEHHGMSSGIPDEIILSLQRGSGDQVWIGTHDQGFGTYDPNQKIFFTSLDNWNYGPINKITSNTKGKLFIGTEREGLFSFDPNGNILVNLSEYIPDIANTISDLVIDDQKNLWIASNSSYLNLVNEHFLFFDLDIEGIQAICHDQKNSIWIGTSQGLYNLDLNRGKAHVQKHDLVKKLNIISLDIDSNGILWIGTFGQGLFCYHPENGTWLTINENSNLPNNSILSVKCHNEEVWLATLGGASHITYKENIFSNSFDITNHSEGLGSNYIYHIFIDSKSNIWFGTDGQGLSYLDKQGFKHFTESSQGQPFKTIYSISEDKFGRIWIINNEGKVFYQHGGKFVQFDKIRPGLDMAGMTANHAGEIVISHRDGLVLIHPENLHVSYLSEEFDLSNLQPDLNTLTTDHNGNVWIGSGNRLIRYKSPDAHSYFTPETHITQVSLFDEPVFRESPILFKSNENYISFHYVGVSFLTPKKIQYRYMLDGYERSWNITSDQRISYSRLPSGNYTFKIQSSFTDQFENMPINTISFQIKKAIYDRAGFWVAVVMLGYLLLYLFGKSRERKLQTEARRKREQIEFQYHQLQSQINPHFLFNSYNTLLNIIEEKPEVASEYVEKLSDFYRQILTLKEKDIITLREEIQLVNDYFYLLQKRYGKNIQLDIDVRSTHRYVAPLSLQMLVENAVKHNIISKKYPLQIRIKEQDSNILVTNNLQAKLNSERSTGYGLRNIKERYAILSNQPVEVHQSEFEFSVSLPFIKKKSIV